MKFLIKLNRLKSPRILLPPLIMKEPPPFIRCQLRWVAILDNAQIWRLYSKCFVFLCLILPSVDLELVKVRDVMASPVRTIRATESAGTLAKLLADTDHSCFPVTKRDPDTGLDLCYGMITRSDRGPSAQLE